MLWPRTQQYCCTHTPQTNRLRLSSSARDLLSATSYLLIAFFCLPALALAQSSTATLSGTVEDQTGAVVSGANIALVSTTQGTQRLTTTSDEGRFVFALLPPGQYSVTATREGFAPVEVKSVTLNVNAQVRLRITLTIGKISQSVEIVDGALINESAAVETVVDRQFVENLPLNGRSIQSLMTLTPGVVQTRVSSNDLGQFSVNGQRADANYFTVDGVSANAAISGNSNQGQTLGGALPSLTAFGGTNNLVSVDALQEFKVMTSSYAAEFGRTPGAQVSLVTRSAQTPFMATFSTTLETASSMQTTGLLIMAGLKKPALRQNDFWRHRPCSDSVTRFSEGGRQPLYDGSNRTFLFFSYEGLVFMSRMRRLRKRLCCSKKAIPSSPGPYTPSPTIRKCAQCEANTSGLSSGLRVTINLHPVPASSTVDHSRLIAKVREYIVQVTLLILLLLGCCSLVLPKIGSLIEECQKWQTLFNSPQASHPAAAEQ